MEALGPVRAAGAAPSSVGGLPAANRPAPQKEEGPRAFFNSTLAGWNSPPPGPCILGGLKEEMLKAVQSQSLNADPYNLRSEELAIAECARGAEVRRMWSEQELVRSFGGQMFPGTPDGVFETWDGALTCVQVVRVPLTANMDEFCMQDVLSQTVLTKVVKSQNWLRVSHLVPHDFVIFCWLPFSIPESAVTFAEELMRRVQVLDPRFSLKLGVPAEPGALFPALFASQSRELKRNYCESDVSALASYGDDSDDDEIMWDITWAWESEDSEVYTQVAAQSETFQEKVGAGDVTSDDDEPEMEWDITWDWQCSVRTSPRDSECSESGEQSAESMRQEECIVSEFPVDNG